MLAETGFARASVGQWTKEDTLREFGRPASIERVRNWAGDIVTYRWQDAQAPMLFYVDLEVSPMVQHTGAAAELPREPWC